MLIQKIKKPFIYTLAFVGAFAVVGCTHADTTPTSNPTKTNTAQHLVQVRTLIQGSGQYITKNDEVEMRFRSYLPDGTPLDGTMNNIPAIIPVSQMFAGLQNALIQMQAGGKYSVKIPASMGFSEEGKPYKQAVNYEIEILRVNP